jgi:hypothetical protein
MALRADSPDLENASAWQRTSHLDEIVVPESESSWSATRYTGFMPPGGPVLAAALLVVLVPGNYAGC